MMRRTPDCPKCGEDGLVLYRALDSLRLVCIDCAWRTSQPLVDGMDIDDAIAAAVAKAQEPDEAPHGYLAGTGKLAYVPAHEVEADSMWVPVEDGEWFWSEMDKAVLSISDDGRTITIDDGQFVVSKTFGNVPIRLCRQVSANA